MRAPALVALAFLLLLPGAWAVAPQGPTIKYVNGPELMAPDPLVYPAIPFRNAPDAQRAPLVPYEAAVDVKPARPQEKLIVLLIEFQDVSATTSPSTIDRLLFSTTPGDKSLADYYRENSYGQTVVTGSVTATWIRSSRNMADYGRDSSSGIDDYHGPIYRLVTEAVQLADSTINFRDFDTDGDGVVVHLMVVHAGAGQETNAGNPDLIWSHRWAVLDADPGRLGDQPLMTDDGVRVYSYFMAAENSPLGVFAHEFGHDFGLPDLYDTDSSSKGAGVWDIMAGGSWLGFPVRGSNPAHFSAWSKVKLGWIDPVVVTTPLIQTEVPRVETYPVVFKLPIRSSPSGDEYFMVENRQQFGYDSNLPASGILIWHVDDSLTHNDNDNHRLVDLVERDNCDCPDRATNVWADDPTGFTPTSTPNSNGHGGVPTNWMVKRISPSRTNMTADISQEVGLNLAVVQLRRDRFVPVGQPAAISAEVANKGALDVSSFSVNFTVYRDVYHTDTIVDRSAQTVGSLPSGLSINLSWSYTPTQVGRYVLEVTADLPGDEIPVDDFMIQHLTAITWIFRDTAEGGTNGWTNNTAAGSGYDWRLVADGDGYGSSYSPTHSWRFGYFQAGNTSQPYYTLTSTSVSLGGRTPYLSFFHRYELAGKVNSTPGIPMQPINSDEASVEVSVDGGPWVQVSKFLGTQASWDHYYVDLSGYVTTTSTALRLRFNATARVMPNEGGWWLDDITVLDNPLTPGVAVRAVDSYMTVPPGGRAIYRFVLINLGDVAGEISFAVGLPAGWSAVAGYNETGLSDAAAFTSFLRGDGSAVVLLGINAPILATRGTRVTGTLTASVAGGQATSSFTFIAEVSSGFYLNLNERTILLIIVGLVALVAIAIVVTEVKKRRKRSPYPTRYR